VDGTARGSGVSLRWIILADDRTGAADAAVAFARRGYDTVVRWGAPAPVDGAAVLAIDLDSRTAAASAAASRHGDAVRRYDRPGQTLFKKIDSTLRGHPAAEMAATATALRERGRPSWGLLAPANPALRRTTRGGRVFVDGAPLEETAIWQREHSYPAADLGEMVRSAGLRAMPLALETLRDDGAALRCAFRAAAAADDPAGTILVCDAETDRDLERLVATARDVTPGYFIGTAGLAKALAAAAPGVPTANPALATTPRGTLVAVGTLAAVSREAARRLATHEGVETVRIDTSGPDWSGAAAQAGPNIGARLGRGETVVAVLDGPDLAGHAVDPRPARRFAALLGNGLEQMGALIVTGGDTAAAILARCDVHGIRLLDEIEPGVALGLTLGAVAVPVVTKPGAFGDEDSLIRCVDGLRDRRRHV
jgi:uncharacterized protein YgbK (DUF1537 family)